MRNRMLAWFVRSYAIEDTNILSSFRLCQISSPTTIVERAGAYAWSHKNWRVREEFARTAASALNLFTAAELPFQRLILPSVRLSEI